jgi:hypothetical protein
LSQLFGSHEAELAIGTRNSAKDEVRRRGAMTGQVGDSQAPVQTGQGSTRAIRLTAALVGGRVEISGNGGANLPKGARDQRFEFELDDQTGLNVRFKRVNDGMLDVKDNSRDCPPPTGMDTNQIVGVTRMSDVRAGFTDKNDNAGGPMPVSYQLNFECDDPTKHPIRYDPIIINGGQ